MKTSLAAGQQKPNELWLKFASANWQISPRMNTDDTDLQTQNGLLELS
jgi:hypothetical protein